MHRRVYFDSHNREQQKIANNIALLNMTMNGPLLFSYDIPYIKKRFGDSGTILSTA
jgi:hypothetical protein